MSEYTTDVTICSDIGCGCQEDDALDVLRDERPLIELRSNMPSNAEWQAQVMPPTCPTVVHQFLSNPHMLHLGFRCSSFSNVLSNRHELFFFSWCFVLFRECHDESNQCRSPSCHVLVFVERAMKVDQSAHHRIIFDTILEHDTMGSVLKKLGIGSECFFFGGCFASVRSLHNVLRPLSPIPDTVQACCVEVVLLPAAVSV